MIFRQENVEKTLHVLEHVISYYDVARNTQTLIREGPNGQLDNYLDSLEKIKAAIAYFDTNCPDSVEQVRERAPMHYGTEQPDCGTLKSRFPTSLGVSERASEQMSERSGARERSEQCGASKRVSSASERANGQASGPVLTSRFLAFLTHRALGWS